jgi:hypothetical protein
MCDFSVIYFCFPLFKYPLWVIRLIDFMTQLSAIYKLDTWFPATIFLASAYVSIADLDQEYRCLCPKV